MARRPRARARSSAWFSTIPLRTMWIASSQSPCGWAFSSVTRPWVAQRVWASPIVAGGRGDGDAAPVAVDRRRAAGAQVGEVADRAHGVDRARSRAARCRPSHSRGTRASRARDQQIAAGTPADVSDDSAHEAGKGRAPGRDAAQVRLAVGRSSAELGARRPRPAARRPPRPRCSSGASTITRTSGSVPEGRTSTRPRPSSAALSRSTASQTGARAVERLAVGDLDVLEHAAAASRIGSPSASRGRRARRIDEQRGGDPVAGRRELGPDHVARLLAAERPAARSSSARDVAVADRRRRHLDPGLVHRAVKAVVAHHRHRDAAVEPARRARGAARDERDQLVAVADLALARRRRSRGRRRRRRRSRSSAPLAGDRARPAPRGGSSRSPR